MKGALALVLSPGGLHNEYGKSAGRSDGRSICRKRAKRPARRLQRPAGPRGPHGHDEVGSGERQLGVCRPSRKLARPEAARSIRSPGKMEWNGTSILEVADPANPKLVWHIPNETNRNSRGVSVVYDYGFDGSGPRLPDSQLREPHEGETGKDLKYQIFDITSRDTDPSKISLVSEITGTPPNSCGPGCGGKFILRAHKGWWSQDTGYFYAASGEPGFRNVVIQIFDLKNPKEPKLVGRAWLPGQKDGEPGYEGQYAHHPVVDEEQQAAVCRLPQCGRPGGAFDISDPAHPKLVWSIDMNPPHRGPHTVSPIVYDTVPNFGKTRCPGPTRTSSTKPAAPLT